MKSRCERGGLKGHDSKQNGVEIKKNSGLPVDRGWSWIILIASFLTMMISNGGYRSFGILFTEIQLRFGSSSTLTALIGSFLNATYSLTSLFVSTIGLRYFSERKFVAVGGTVLSLSYILAGFAPNIETAIFCLGCLGGLGHGLLQCPVTTLLSQYFEKRRSFANGLAVTGASVGSLVYSVIIRIFIERFAFTGMMMILGGISLQILVCSTLMRPRSYYSSRVSFDICVSKDKEVTKPSCNGWEKINNNTRNGIDDSNKTANDDVEEVSIPMTSGVEEMQNGLLSNGVQSTSYLEKNQDNVEISANIVSPLLGTRSPRKERSDSNMSNKHPLEKTKAGLVSRLGSSLSALSSSNIGRFASTDLSMSSSLDIAGSFVKVNNQLEDGDSTSSGGDINEVNPRTCAICDLSVLRRWSFLCFLPCAGFIITISTIPMFLPPYAIDSGLSSKESDFLITLISITEIVGTITWGLIADKGIIQRHKIISISACSAGIATFLAPLFRSEATFLVYSAWYGFYGRVYFGLYPIVLVDFLGLENLGPALGIASVIQTASNAIMQPVIGVIRDATGSYVPGLLLMASQIFIGGLGLLTLPLAEKLERNMKEKSCHKKTNLVLKP